MSTRLKPNGYHTPVWRLRWVAAAALAGLTLAAHAPALPAGFVWDDDAYVTENAVLADAAGLARIWLEPGATPQYYPLTFTTLWLEHAAWGTAPLGYHVVNLLLHALAAILLWRLLERLEVPGAWAAAALFAVHPITVESVAWVAEVKNVQSMVLALASLLAYLRFARPDDGHPRGGHGWYAASLALFAASLLSKPAAVALPLVVLLLAWWRRGRLGRRDLTAVAPMLAMAAAMSAMTIWAETAVSGARGWAFDLELAERVLVAGRGVWFYAAKLAWPSPLVSIYPRWDVESAAWWWWAWPAAAAAALAALWLGRRRLGRGPLAAVATFVLLLAPTLGLVDVGYHLNSFVADHFAYHAAPALLALAATGWARFTDRAGSRGLVPAARGALAAVLAVLGVLSFNHARIFANEKTRCLDTLAKNPSAWLCHNNLGVVLAREGSPAEAVASYEAALRLRPRYAEAHSNLGVALMALGRHEEAIAQYQAALAIWPEYAAAHNNLGVALASTGDTEGAIRHYREALRIRPDDAEAHNNLGKAFSASGQGDLALEQYRKAVRLAPSRPEARVDLGLALAAAGRRREAIAQYREALRLRPDDATAHNNLGVALAAEGKVTEAVAHLEQAVLLRPDDATAHNNLGRVLAASGARERAVDHLEQAVRLRPDYAEAHNNLGTALASAGRVSEAVAHYREAVRLQPANFEARRNLGSALASVGAVEEAAPELREAVRLEPTDADAHNALGVVLASLGRLDEATAHFERAVALDPDDASYRSNLDRANALRRHGMSAPDRR
jgi:Flp pilus assembly protein TadD